MVTITLWLALASGGSNRPAAVLERFTDRQACIEFATKAAATSWSGVTCIPADKVYRP